MDLKFIIPKPLLNIPSLEMICRNLQTNIIKELRAYSHEFKLMLTKHLTTETEVQIVNGLVTATAESITAPSSLTIDCLREGFTQTRDGHEDSDLPQYE